MKETMVKFKGKQYETHYKVTREGTCYLVTICAIYEVDEHGSQITEGQANLSEDELDAIESKIGYQEYRADH